MAEQYDDLDQRFWAGSSTLNTFQLLDITMQMNVSTIPRRHSYYAQHIYIATTTLTEEGHVIFLKIYIAIYS